MNDGSSGVGDVREADLRLTSDAFLQRLDRLYELEVRKRELPPDQPEFARIAREVEDTARALLGTSINQTHLADASIEMAKRPDKSTLRTPIREVPPTRRDATTVLSDWRAAERRLASAPAGSQDEAAARVDVERLRAEYRKVTDSARV